MEGLPSDEIEEGEIEGQVAAEEIAPPSSKVQKIKAEDVHHQQTGDNIQLTRKQRRQLKKLKKSASCAQNQPAACAATDGGKGFYDVYGENARASVEIKAENPIRLIDVQALVLWTLADHISPRWMFLKNKPLVERVVMILAHGITPQLFAEKKEHMPTLEQFGKPATVIGLNAQVRPAQTAAALLSTPVEFKRKRKGAPQEQAGGSAEGAIEDGSGSKDAPGCRGKRHRVSLSPPFPPTHYVMSLKEMETYNYPLPVVLENGELACPEGWVATQPAASTSQQEGAGADSMEYHMVALDCEMCITSQGFELTRATLVDRQGKVLLDEYVVPENPITDYNTRYSGITAETLRDCKNCLQDIQARFLQLVSAETLLVGHSLENDLVALKVLHTRLLDTSVLYPHPRGPPYKPALKVLASKFLKRRIQDGSHDSIIDATTAMDLVNLKIKHGPSYGSTDSTEKMNKLVDILGEDHGRRCCLVDRKETLTRFATGSAAAVPVFSDAEAADAAAKQSQATYHFVWTQFTELSTFFFQRSLHRQKQSAGASTSHAVNSEQPAATAAAAAAASAAAAATSTVAAATSTSNSLQQQQPGISHQPPEEATPSSSAAAAAAAAIAVASHKDLEQAHFGEHCLYQVLERLDSHVKRVHAALPANSLLIVATGQGDTPEVRRAMQQKYRRQNGLDGLPPWTVADENAFAEMAEAQLQGLCFCTVKQ